VKEPGQVNEPVWAALAEARDTTEDHLAEQLTDAQRYDDTVVVRATVTAMIERGRSDLV
jgi:hypothetical protein